MGEASRRISTVWSQVCRRNRKHVARRLGLGCITRQEGGLQAKEELGSRLNRASPSFQRPATLPSLHYIDSSFLSVFFYTPPSSVWVCQSLHSEMKWKQKVRGCREAGGGNPPFSIWESPLPPKKCSRHSKHENVWSALCNSGRRGYIGQKSAKEEEYLLYIKVMLVFYILGEQFRPCVRLHGRERGAGFEQKILTELHKR